MPDDTPKDIAFFYSVATGWFLSPQVIGAAIKFGLATQEQFDQWRVDLDEWKTNPAASGAVAFGECMAYQALVYRPTKRRENYERYKDFWPPSICSSWPQPSLSTSSPSSSMTLH